MPRIPIDDQVDVFLVRSVEDAGIAQITTPALVVVPDRGDWNDFHNNFHARLHILDDGEPLSLPMKLMFEGRRRTHEAADELRGDTPRLNLDEVEHPHVSILAREEDYRTMVLRLGFGLTVAALRSLGDAVLAVAEGDDATVLRLIESEDFHQSALRDEKNWAAFRYGARHLRPAPPEVDVADAKISFTARVALPGLPNAYELDADFADHIPLGERCLVLVGRNGTGKTRLLLSIVDGLRANTQFADLRGSGPEAEFDPKPSLTRLVVMSSVATDSYSRSIPPWSGLDYQYYSMVGLRGGSIDDLALALADCIRDDPETSPFEGATRMELLDRVLEPMGIKRWLHVEVRQQEINNNQHQPVMDGDKTYLKLFRGYGEQQRLQMIARIIPGASPVIIAPDGVRQLSSGEMALLRFAAQATAAAQRGTIYLFDEPETHLHPNYISTFMAMLDRLLELTGSIALIATHSAYIVREVPSRRVRMLSVVDDQALIDAPRMQTFGASIDMISQFIFRDAGPVHRYQEALRAWTMAQPVGLTIDLIVERFGDDLNAESLSFIAHVLRERAGP